MTLLHPQLTPSPQDNSSQEAGRLLPVKLEAFVSWSESPAKQVWAVQIPHHSHSAHHHHHHHLGNLINECDRGSPSWGAG